MILNSEIPSLKVFEANAVSEAINHAPVNIDVVLLDIQLKGSSGLEGITLLKEKWPLAYILMLSSQDDPETAHMVLEHSADGFVSKLWLLGDPAYNALSMAGVLYTATLLGQARNRANAARASLELRFENVELVERLSKEKESAQTAHQEAEQANIAKSKFLAAASHDLRQPIHAQSLFLDVLSRTNLNAQQRELID